jgi:hypothetical protein
MQPSICSFQVEIEYDGKWYACGDDGMPAPLSKEDELIIVSPCTYYIHNHQLLTTTAVVVVDIGSTTSSSSHRILHAFTSKNKEGSARTRHHQKTRHASESIQQKSILLQHPAQGIKKKTPESCRLQPEKIITDCAKYYYYYQYTSLYLQRQWSLKLKAEPM